MNDILKIFLDKSHFLIPSWGVDILLGIVAAGLVLILRAELDRRFGDKSRGNRPYRDGGL